MRVVRGDRTGHPVPRIITTEARFLFVSYLLARGKTHRVQLLKVDDWTE